MLAEERQDLILLWVNEHKTVSTESLLKRLNVSKMTLWRDLKSLEERNKIRRVYGGAMAVDDGSRPEPAFDSKRVINHEQKNAIARYAARNFIADGDILILEGGTTIVEMVQYIERSDITILSHGLNTLMAASKRMPDITVIGCGGILREASMTFVGPDAEAFFHNSKADTAFMSGEGITVEDGITDINPLENQVKRAMVKSADRVIGMMDSSKIGKRSLSEVATRAELSAVITDDAAPPEFRREAERWGIELHIVEVSKAE